MKSLLKLLYGATLVLLVPTIGLADVVTGNARIISAETLQIGSTVFRLAGIDAPEVGQICNNKSGKEFDCGRIAATALMDLTAGATVRCTSLDDIIKSPILARCDVDGYDLAEGMVYTGWALPDPVTGTAFEPYQIKAMKKKHGLWAGQFQLPWIWRNERSQ
ncbi:MAG: thermonuclease family protein [Sneathiella sp.]